ncbi:MAG: hypothetical protein GXO43_01855 [Crenarchaeota archaeon]|nr:hypothetical protein [Thermoproteota archaeon]
MSLPADLVKPPYTRERIDEILNEITRLGPNRRSEALAGLSLIIDRQEASREIYLLGIKGELADIGEKYIDKLPLSLCPQVFKSSLISLLVKKIKKPIPVASLEDSLRRIHGYMTYMNPLAILYILWKNPEGAKNYFAEIISKNILVDLANPDLRYTVIYRDILVALSPILSVELFKKYYEPAGIPDEALEAAEEIGGKKLDELLALALRSYLRILVSVTQVLRSAAKAEDYLENMKLETSGLIKYREILGKLVKTSKNLMQTSLDTLTVRPEEKTAKSLAEIVAVALRRTSDPEDYRIALNLLLEASLAPPDLVEGLNSILGRISELLETINREELSKLCSSRKGRLLIERLSRHSDKKWISKLGINWTDLCRS